MYAAADNEALQSRLRKYWVALLQSNTSLGNSVLSQILPKFVDIIRTFSWFAGLLRAWIECYKLLCNVLNLLAATVWTCDRESLLDLSGMSTLPNMHRQSTCVYFQVLMWMAGDILRWNGSGQYIQGVFSNWCSPKIHKYGEKLMYQNWCPLKIHKYGENCPQKSAIGIPLFEGAPVDT